MGRAIAKHFFHGDQVGKGKNNRKRKSFYFDKIPLNLDKIYLSVKVELKEECKSLNCTDPCLPKIIVLDEYLEEFKSYIQQSNKYTSLEYNIDYQNEVPYLLDLLKSHKYFMYYLHLPKKETGYWFCEGRFFTLEELQKTKDLAIQEKILKFVEEKKIDYFGFLEEWVGLIFHLASEYLLFGKKFKTIFFSCQKCNRPGVFIKEELKDGEDAEKIYGTINIVDTIIDKCIQDLEKAKISIEEKSNNNIILYDESYDRSKNDVYEEYEKFREKTDGAFIIATSEKILDNLIEEFKGGENKYNFSLIIKGAYVEKILNKIKKDNLNRYFGKKCAYKLPRESNADIQNFEIPEQIIENFILLQNENTQIYDKTFKLITFKDYNNRYIDLHKFISKQYGENKEKIFNYEISYLKDFLFWYPKLKYKNPEEDENKSKFNSFYGILKKFKKITNNEEYIIKLYTEEKGSYYKDFNNWLNKLDPLAIYKTSWFIAAVMLCLNNYSNNKNLGIKENGFKLYRGFSANLSTLLNYSEGDLICYPGFTSTSKSKDQAVRFSKRNTKDEYETIITINYIYKDGFKPTAVDVTKISAHEEEEECLIFPYSFFKIKKVKIDHDSEIKKAEIELDAIGRKEILELQLKNGGKLIENKEGYMEYVEEQQNQNIIMV